MKSTFGERLQQARQARELTQSQLALALGWEDRGQGRISNYERDTREPTLHEIERLSTELRISAAWLAFGVEPMCLDTGVLEAGIGLLGLEPRDHERLRALVADYLALPEAFRTYASHKVGAARAYAASLPTFVLDVLKAPDGDDLRKWARSIDDAI